MSFIELHHVVLSIVFNLIDLFKIIWVILPWARQWRSSWAGLGYVFEHLCESRATTPHQAQPGSTSRRLHLADGWGLHACIASVLAHLGLHTPPRQRQTGTHGFPRFLVFTYSRYQHIYSTQRAKDFVCFLFFFYPATQIEVSLYLV